MSLRQNFNYGIRGYYWFTAIEGEIKLDDGGIDGTFNGVTFNAGARIRTNFNFRLIHDI